MPRTILCLLQAITVVTLLASTSLARTWTDRMGRTVEAEFIAFAQGKVRIKRNSDGKVFEVPLEQLCDADQAFVKSQTNRVVQADVKSAGDDIRTIKPIMGVPAYVDGRINKETSRTIVNHLKELGRDGLSEWEVALSKATGEKRPTGKVDEKIFLSALLLPFEIEHPWTTPTDSAFFICGRMTVLFDNGKLDPSISRQLLTRLDTLEPDAIAMWQGALQQATGKKINRLFTAGAILPMDELYVDNKYSEAKAKKYISRLKQVPDKSVKYWKDNVDQFGGSVVDAAMNMIRIDSFFPGEQYSEDVFRNVTDKMGATIESDKRERTDGKAESDQSTKARSEDTKRKLASNWPAMTGVLTGRMQVRIKNPNQFAVKVGLRSNGEGKDFNVAANETESVFVPNGRYDIYFQYSTDPDGLYQGDSFTLNNNGVEIEIVKVVGGNYQIKKVK